MLKKGSPMLDSDFENEPDVYSMSPRTYISRKTKSEDLSKFIDELTDSTNYMNSIPKLNSETTILLSEISVESMKNNKILQGVGKIDHESKLVPFIAFCVKNVDSETITKANLQVLVLTISPDKEEKPTFLLIMNNGNTILEYPVGEDFERSLSDILKPLINGGYTEGFKINQISQAVSPSNIKITLSDQTELENDNKNRTKKCRCILV